MREQYMCQKHKKTAKMTIIHFRLRPTGGGGVSKQIVPFSSSKCCVCHAHQQLVHKRTIQQFHKKCALQQSLVLVHVHVHHHLPIHCYSCQTHDHHTTLQSWTKHMLPAQCLEICKTQSRRPSQHLAQFCSHARHHPHRWSLSWFLCSVQASRYTAKNNSKLLTM